MNLGDSIRIVLVFGAALVALAVAATALFFVVRSKRLSISQKWGLTAAIAFIVWLGSPIGLIGKTVFGEHLGRMSLAEECRNHFAISVLHSASGVKQFTVVAVSEHGALTRSTLSTLVAKRDDHHRLWPKVYPAIWFHGEPEAMQSKYVVRLETRDLRRFSGGFRLAETAMSVLDTSKNLEMGHYRNFELWHDHSRHMIGCNSTGDPNEYWITLALIEDKFLKRVLMP